MTLIATVDVANMAHSDSVACFFTAELACGREELAICREELVNGREELASSSFNRRNLQGVGRNLQ